MLPCAIRNGLRAGEDDFQIIPIDVRIVIGRWQKHDVTWWAATRALGNGELPGSGPNDHEPPFHCHQLLSVPRTKTVPWAYRYSSPYPPPACTSFRRVSPFRPNVHVAWHFHWRMDNSELPGSGPKRDHEPPFSIAASCYRYRGPRRGPLESTTSIPIRTPRLRARHFERVSPFQAECPRRLAFVGAWADRDFLSQGQKNDREPPFPLPHQLLSVPRTKTVPYGSSFRSVPPACDANHFRRVSPFGRVSTWPGVHL